MTRTPIILQTEAAECGLACLAMVAGHHGRVTDLAALRRRWSISTKGVTLAHLIAMAQGLKLAARALRADLADLGDLRAPAVLHWDLNHFVVLERVSRKHAWIADPAVGRRRLALTEVSAHYTGIALELLPADGFERRRDASALPLRAFFRGTTGLGGALARVHALSVALQALALTLPFFSQVIIDEIIVSGDRGLLTALGVAFLLVVAVQACLNAVRGWITVSLAATLQFGWAVRLFRHLVRLPLDWYEKRHVGDVVSRFGSLRAVERVVAGTMVEAVIDGLMAATTLMVMLIYSVPLAAITACAVAAYALGRTALLGRVREVDHEALTAQARDASVFMESVRAIAPLKVYGKEGLRESVWQSDRARAVRAEVRAGRLQLAQQVLNGGLFAAENVVLLWVGALAVLDHALSLGMLVAFVAYKSQFVTKAASLVDRLIELGLLRVHLDRVADIALAAPDPGVAASAIAAAPVRGGIATRGLAFRYADIEPFVFEGLDLDIRAGECVALAARSGFGKTTLLKLLLGLLTPTAGSVLVDGVELRGEALARVRARTAAVLQDDALLSGTLLDNIAFFDPQPDERRLVACAQLAAIHDDIAAMPLGFMTLVGDMGSTLSGGQRQRVLLARALYSRPRILFLDEATSHLDPATERRIHAALRGLSITRVMIAHRRETLAIADRVIALDAR